MSFTITNIVGKSDVPLYLYDESGSRIVVDTTTFYQLWGYGGQPTANTFVAFSSGHASSNFRVGIKASDDLVGKTLSLQGTLNGDLAVQSSINMDANEVVADNFYLVNQFQYPMAYRGDFYWKLVDDNRQTAATCSTVTYLEMYALIAPITSLWPSFGVSANLLRQYIPVRTIGRIRWRPSDFYKDLTNNIFGGQFYYDNVYGGARYSASQFGDSYKLDQYFVDLSTGQAMDVNCYDMAGIVQIVLSLYPDYGQVKWNYMTPYGWINPTILKGWPQSGPCNNPFWGNSAYYPAPIAQVNYQDNQLQRSRFGNHSYIVAPDDGGGTCILDSTSGPHVGDEDLDTYLQNAIDHTTDYYKHYDDSGPGTAADIQAQQTGITSVTTLDSATSMASAAGPVPPEGSITTHSPLDVVMDRSKVENPDPPRFSEINPTALSKELERKCGLPLAIETIEPGKGGSRAYWRFRSDSKMVEVTLYAVDSHATAVQIMKETVGRISAPLDAVFASTMRLGQRVLHGIGGYGFIHFVRGNVFVTLRGLSHDELGEIAVDVDKWLKEREGDADTVYGPHIDGEIQSRQMKVGDTLEVAVPVKEAGWMTALTNAAVVQLLEVDVSRAMFKLHAGAKGVVDVQFVFAHATSLQTSTATMHIEVVDADSQE